MIKEAESDLQKEINKLVDEHHTVCLRFVEMNILAVKWKKELDGAAQMFRDVLHDYPDVFSDDLVSKIKAFINTNSHPSDKIYRDIGI